MVENNPWDEFIRRAKRYCAAEELQPGKNYKVGIGRRLEKARSAVLAEADDWATLVIRGLTSNLVNRFSLIWFRNWINGSPAEALRALQELWAENNASVDQRIRAFSNGFPPSVMRGLGTRMNVISVLLMGLDFKQYPPFRVTAFNDTYDRVGYDRPQRGVDEAAMYEHALDFLDRFIEEAGERGLPVPNRLDAQSFVWLVWAFRDEPGDPPHKDSLTEAVPASDLAQPNAWLNVPVDLTSLAEELYLTEPSDFLENINTLLADKKQVIFQGPPGTGKTYVARELANHLAGSEDRVTFVQFHPSFAYEDFVRGFRPALVNGQPGFELKDGPLLQAAERARKDEKRNVNHFLVIDEINRGNLAKVFGELYFLLEYRDEAITLQYQRVGEEKFSLPSNLYIIGTMNTADRSIALVDLALRRRFYFVEFHPDDEPVKGVLRRWLKANNMADMEWVAKVVERANELLKDDRHAAIGPSYFMKEDLDDDKVERIWKHSVLPYIEERRFGGDEVSDDFDLEKLKGSIKAGGGTEDGEDGAENQDSGTGDASD